MSIFVVITKWVLTIWKVIYGQASWVLCLTTINNEYYYWALLIQTFPIWLPYCNSSHFKVNTFLFSHTDGNHILAINVFSIYMLLSFLVKILLCLQQFSTTLYIIYPIHSMFILYVKIVNSKVMKWITSTSY